MNQVKNHMASRGSGANCEPAGVDQRQYVRAFPYIRTREGRGGGLRIEYMGRRPTYLQG